MGNFDQYTWSTYQVPGFCDPCGLCGNKCCGCKTCGKSGSHKFKLVIPTTSPISIV